MSKIQVLYEGGSSTLCIRPDTGVQIKTDLELNFSPTDLFAASLGSCFITIMSLAAKKLQVDIAGSRVEVIKEMSNNSPRRVSKLEVHFFCPKRFSSEIEEQLVKSAKACPIHHSLHPDLIQEFFIHWEGT
ncbi:MAG: OsmC family protein [Verrucomicrobia bacterium]|nr:OsmC family protein [Verrucomicrobiota bacterium]